MLWLKAIKAQINRKQAQTRQNKTVPNHHAQNPAIQPPKIGGAQIKTVKGIAAVGLHTLNLSQSEVLR
jgi:hypothetical protein